MSEGKDLDSIIAKQKSKTKDLDVDSDDLALQIAHKKLEAARYESDIKDRKWLAIWTASIVTLWLVAVIVILILNDSYICLSNTVLVTLLGTTTLNVLGLPLIVLRGHFPASGKKV